MKRRAFMKTTGLMAFAGGSLAGLTRCTPASKGTEQQPAGLQKGEILHTVIFDLKYPVGSAEAKQFLADGTAILTKVPGVEDFQAYRQCSPKNDYQYGFFMRFKDQQTFDAYTAHPDHCKFVTERWDTEVTRFQESDFEQL